eukprot:TRINITY_DN488_c0_g1_i2.p2 TRINITY_DN488_c0_g1~~TRINITY_DN488_c0_g1_i2.p2  ORF type:complete len:224 (-),score=34.30 TRINITY_DN488_c0_g1_i2:1134-1805(-)
MYPKGRSGSPHRVKWYLTCLKELAKSVPDNEVVQKVLNDASLWVASAPSTPVESKQAEDHIMLIQGAVKQTWPQDANLDELNKAMASLEIDEDTRLRKQHILHILEEVTQGGSVATDSVDPENAVLWAVGKKLERSKTLKELIKTTESTTLKCKLTKDKAPQPSRPGPLTNQEQHEMMAYWRKKQDEQERLEKDDDIDYGNREWANPKALQNSLRGAGDIKVK